jgi:HK97 family phage portal protein
MNPSLVLEVPSLPDNATNDVVDQLRQTVMERNSGPQNAGRPLVLTGGTKASPVMLSPADAQFLETRKFQINEICRWFRVPPHKVQDIVQHASQGGGSGIEQQSTEFAADTLRPLATKIERADSQLLPRGQYVRYNTDAYVRTDLAAQTAYFTQGRLGGWLCADDIRSLKDMAPLPDGQGQIFLQPLNYIEAGTTPDVTATAPGVAA